MLVLGIETSTDNGGISLVDESGLLAELSVGYSRRHIETVTPGIEALLQVVGMDISAIDGVAVDVGPGLFTGLRVGVATAKSLCYALGIKAVALGSLDVLAEGVLRAVHVRYLHDWVVAPVVDVKRGELFWNTYVIDGALPDGAVVPVDGTSAGHSSTTGSIHLVATGTPRLSSPRELAGSLVATARSDELQKKIFMVGSGVLNYPEELLPLQARGVKLGGPMLAMPSAGVLASLGLERLMMGQYGDYGELTPQYAREPDAVVNWKRRDTGRPKAQAAAQDTVQDNTLVE